MDLLKKIINKHTLALASNAVMPVVGMLTLSLLAHFLSKAAFGNWILFLITYTLSNFFRSGFLQTALVKFYSGAGQERALNVAGSTWFLGFALTLTLASLSFLAFLFFHVDVSTEIIIKWFGIIFLSSLPSNIALWILQAEERFDRIFILQLIGQVCFFLAIVTLIIFHQTHFQNVIYAYCISEALTSLFALVTGWANIRSIVYKSRVCIKELANFGKYSVGTSISSYLLRGSDTFIIKFMFVNPAFVGIYYLPQRLMEIIEIPLRSFIATAMPAMSAASYRDDTKLVTYIMKKYAGILTILLVPVLIVAIISAYLLIDVIGGKQFVQTEAANIFRIFMCFAILLPVDRFFGITLDILNKPHINMIKVILMLTVNVVGDFIGIYITHSIYGVALASIFTFLIGILYGYWMLKKFLNFTLMDIVKVGIIETKLIIIDLPNRFKTKDNIKNI
ncbi:MAG TPA: oligosaccharide flippase family protein [Mucilaginibacter sp.]